MKKRTKIIIGIIIAIIILMIIGSCGDSSNDDNSTPSASTETTDVQNDNAAEAQNDTSSDNSNSTSIFSSEEKKPIELVNGRYWIVQRTYNNELYYAVQIRNPNETYELRFPKIHITAKAADGSILKTEDMTLSTIAANDTIIYGNSIYYEGALADTVEISVTGEDLYYFKQNDSEAVKQSQLTISNTSELPGTLGTKYTGEVTNNSPVDLGMACIIVIYKKDGQMLGGSTGFVDDLKKGETKPFEVSPLGEVEHDSYEVYAIQWP